MTQAKPRKRAPPKAGARNPEVKLDVGAALAQLQATVSNLMVEVATAKQATHDVKGNQQTRIAAEVLTAKATPQQRMTMFQTVVSSLVGLTVLGGLVLAGIQIYAGRQVENSASAVRMASIERELVAFGPVAARLQELSSSIEAGRRIRERDDRTRDQTIQAQGDRILVLERADQAASNAMAALGPQLTDIQRRLDRIERQQQGRFVPQNQDDAPASFVPPHRRI